MMLKLGIGDHHNNWSWFTDFFCDLWLYFLLMSVIFYNLNAWRRIFLIIGIEILVITLYRHLFYYFRVIISNTNTMNNDPTQNNNDNNNNDSNNSNNDNDFNNNISKYYWKIRKNDIFCFHNFWVSYCRTRCYMPPTGKKSVLKPQKVLSKHKQA